MADSADTSQIKSNIQKAYDDIADTYLTWTEPTHGVRLKYVEKMLDKCKTSAGKQSKATMMDILELGCGAGVPVSQYLASQEDIKINVTANDISSAQIEMAKKLFSQSEPESESGCVRFMQGDMTELEFDSRQFDAIVAMYSIIHLPRDEQTTMLQRIFDWLKPGGRILANFSATAFAGASDPSWLGGKKGEMYWSGWGESGTRRILAEIGFEIEVDEIVTDSEEDNGAVRDVPFHWVMARKA